MQTATLRIDIEYDETLTDPESLASAADTLLETALSTPGIRDEFGNPRFDRFFVLTEPAEEAVDAPAPARRLSRFQVERYVRSGGVRCPFCGSDALDSDRPSTSGDDGVFQATCRCRRCRAEWVDEYRLAGISGDEFEIMEGTEVAPYVDAPASTVTYSRNEIELAVAIAHDFHRDERQRQFRERHGKRLGGFVGTADWLIDCAVAFDQAESAVRGRPGEDWDRILAVERYVSDLYERYLDEDRNPRSDDDGVRRRLAADAIAAERQ